ncbi:MAG: peptide/nickel transport system permease protein [Myxococcales bacterium]|nr:peptide/nickel transport system permease protein [Myxococcales bacterium]
MAGFLSFVARRGLGALTAVVLVSLAVFALRHAVPGDPVDAMLGEQASDADRDALRACLDLDKGIGGQLVSFGRDVFSGTLGISCNDRRSTVASLIAAVYPRTIELALAAVALALVLAIPLGTLASLRPGSWLDSAVMAAALAGISVPAMWLGPLLLAFFYVRLGWLPGPADPPSAAGALLLPAFTLASHLAAMLARMTRSSLLEVSSEDFMRTARAKGLSRWAALRRHALPNALLPVVTVAGIQLGALLAGAIITEKIFARPGLGTLLLDSISVRDWKVVQGVVLVIAVSYVLVNVLVDIVYALLDPRIRLH